METNKSSDVKLIAFHLPQFHTFKENDEWWGKGFTEWTNTRKAQRIYPEHNQPREPLNDNYYDLSKIENLLWQMNLAKEYGIYGFCYYHYWFDGKLLLNKPVEMMRDYQGNKLNYCLCWANEPWTRAWEGKKTVLMPQKYGSELDWERHFLYLIDFFKDDFYIKIDNKPVFVLYRCNNIPECDAMIRYWDRRCKESGFKGIYLVEEMNSFQSEAVCESSQSVLEFEPLYTMTFDRTLLEKVQDKMLSVWFNKKYNSHNQIYRYERLWHRILKRNHKDSKQRFLGAFVDWDNTARKGKYGRIVMDTSPEQFGTFLMEQRNTAEKVGSDFIFINAWNEWGEGTYLEPDKVNKYEYLKQIQKVFGGGV